MSTASRFQHISVRDYLASEETANRKHEFVDGVVYAMSGGTVAHSRIACNALAALHSQLRGRRCQVFNSDMKVRVRLKRGTRFYYPDVSVVCTSNPSSHTFQETPVVIVEVISDSSRRADEFEKREAYLSIDSLCVYVLVEQSSAAALVYRRMDSGFDRELHFGLDAVIRLPEIECELRLIDLFENVEFAPVLPSDELDES